MTQKEHNNLNQSQSIIRINEKKRQTIQTQNIMFFFTNSELSFFFAKAIIVYKLKSNRLFELCRKMT